MIIEKKFLEIPFDCINGLVLEPCLKFNSEGLSINSFVESNAAMIIFNLPKSKFIEYDFVGEEKFKINIDMLSKIMKRIKTKNVILNFKDQKIIVSDEKGKEYSIAVMHDEETQRDMPKPELNSSFTIESEKLKEMFLDAEIVGEDIKIETKEKLILSSGNLNKFHQKIEHTIVGEGVSDYSLGYLNKFMNASKYFKDVLFEFSSGGPCKLTFKNDLEIQFILAPCCDD